MNTQSTTEYHIFKKTPHNREIDRSNLEKIKFSIKTRNLLEYRPIIVNADMEVIDGQHRLRAAEILGLPIYYTIQNDSKIEDIYLLNENQKKWKITDYLNYHCAEDNENYIKSDRLCREYSVSITRLFVFLYANPGGDFYKRFRQGKFIFPEDGEEKLDRQYHQYTEIAQFIELRTVGSKDYVRSKKFTSAIVVFLKREDVLFEQFKKQLEKGGLNFVYPCGTSDQYHKMFLKVYNYHSRDPIE